MTCGGGPSQEAASRAHVQHEGFAVHAFVDCMLKGMCTRQKNEACVHISSQGPKDKNRYIEVKEGQRQNT
eukprot:1959770-Amphidinium_carterae.1